MKTYWKPCLSEAPCRKCGTVGQIEDSLWESRCGGFVDAHYHCLACGVDWWCEGGDA